jgi:hypothetical protein
METSQDIPAEICVEIHKEVEKHEKKKEICIDNFDFPRKWNVIILNLECSDPKTAEGICTSVLVLEESFPHENPLVTQLSDENIYCIKKKYFYVIYSEYVKEIKIVLPVACEISCLGYDREKMSLKLNLFLHYISAGDVALKKFKDTLSKTVEHDESLDFFYFCLKDYDQKILCYNTHKLNGYILPSQIRGAPYPWYCEHVIKPYWLHILRNIQNNFSMYTKFDDDKQNNLLKLKCFKVKLKNGGELTYNMCLYLFHKIKTEDKKSKFSYAKKNSKYFYNCTVFLEEALKNTVDEWEKKRNKDKCWYLTTDSIFVPLFIIRSYSEDSFGSIIELLEKYKY